MGMIIKNEMPIKELLTIEDLVAGEVFVLNGSNKIYMMTNSPGFFVHLPSGNLANCFCDEWCNRAVTVINAELIVTT